MIPIRYTNKLLNLEAELVQVGVLLLLDGMVEVKNGSR